MKQNETNLYEVEVYIHEKSTMYVRVPKMYEDSYELKELIKSTFQNEHILVDELNFDERYVETVSVNKTDDDESSSMLSFTKTLLIPTCNPEDLTSETYINESLDVSNID
jgi:hypothetical protein